MQRLTRDQMREWMRKSQYPPITPAISASLSRVANGMGRATNGTIRDELFSGKVLQTVSSESK